MRVNEFLKHTILRKHLCRDADDAAHSDSNNNNNDNDDEDAEYSITLRANYNIE